MRPSAGRSWRPCSLLIAVLAILASGAPGRGEESDAEDAASVSSPASEPSSPAAEAPAEEAHPCPDDVVVSAGWPGEWPGPVVHVASAVELKAFRHPCDPVPTVDCTVPAGVYHPWADTTPDCRTVRAVERFETTRTLSIEARSFPAGTVVEVHQYVGEGFCEMVVGGASMVDACPENVNREEGESYARKGEAVDFAERQVFQVSCDNGAAWILVDDSLFSRPEIRKGQFIEYGRVGPAASGAGAP